MIFRKEKKKFMLGTFGGKENQLLTYKNWFVSN